MKTLLSLFLIGLAACAEEVRSTLDGLNEDKLRQVKAFLNNLR